VLNTGDTPVDGVPAVVERAGAGVRCFLERAIVLARQDRNFTDASGS
jgi:hypothetical protein